MEKTIIEMMTTENLDMIVDDFVNCLEKFKNADTDGDMPGKIDYEFELAREDGQIKNITDANTFLSFDLEPDSTAKNFLMAMYSSDLSDEEVKQVNSFVNLVANRITEDHGQLLKDSIRKSVLPSSQEESIPLDMINIIHVEMVDYSSICEDDRYMLRFAKAPGSSTDMKRIQDFIINRSNDLNTDEDSNDVPIEQSVSSYQIAKLAVKEDHPLFDGIVDIEKGEKYMWDVSMSLFVDYSVSDKYVEQNKRV